MNADLWRQARQVFERALEQAPEARPAFVIEACAGSPELRRAVDTLLACDAQDEHPLESPPLAAMAEIVAGGQERLWIGRQLGPYRIVDKLGEGGMGTVFRAERADAEFEKQVAVKLLRWNWAGADGLERFRRERQILARLEHPNIARLLDGGTTSEGLPYLVMEYVEGVPITEYCDRHQLAIERRIELLRAVCDAVRYAHQNLIVHRDLKASNILVTPDGVPKLLDFGIAKLLGDSLEEAPGRSSTRVLTPGYASPEQVGGRPITTASDVYSLGILLYLLLTGRRPLSWSSASTVAEIERRLLEIEALPPSAALVSADDDGPQPVLDLARVALERSSRPDALRHQLTGDLDNISLRALRKEPERRYGSVEELSEDLRRHLEGLPIHARPAGLGYRAGKFVRRHKTTVAAATVAILSLIGLALFATINSALLARERDAARRERAEAEQVTRLLIDAFRWADPGQAEGKELTARQIVDFGATRVRLELADQPGVRANLLTTLGAVYSSFGEYDQAGSLLDEALEVHRGYHGPGHHAIAGPLHHRAVLEFLEGDYPKAEETARRALEIRRAQAPAAARETQHLLAQIVGAQDRNPEAAELHSSAIEAFEETGAPADDLYVSGLSGLARVYQITTLYPQAEELLRRALTIQEGLHPGPHPLTAEMLRDLTSLLRRMGRAAEAEPFGRQALAILQTLYGDQHPSTARMYGTLGTVYSHLGDFEKAESYQRRAIELQRQLLGDGHPRLTSSMYNLALLLQHDLDRPAQAESIVVEVLRHSRETLGKDHSRLGFILTLYGDILVSQGRVEEAFPRLQEALELYYRISANPARNWNVAMVESSLGNAHMARGELDRAQQYLEKAQTVLDELRGPDNNLSLRCSRRRLQLYELRHDGDAVTALRQRLGQAAGGPDGQLGSGS